MKKKNDIKEIIKEALDRISEREKKILIMRFGLDGNSPTSIKNASKVFNVTDKRISELEAIALKKVRKISEQIHDGQIELYQGKDKIKGKKLADLHVDKSIIIASQEVWRTN